jgi:hypothetical protein
MLAWLTITGAETLFDHDKKLYNISEALQNINKLNV